MTNVDLYEAMSTLRAVRRLRPDAIPDDVLQRVLEAATWAPTGGNRQPWRMIVVKEASAKARLGELYAERWSGFAKGYERLMDQMPDAAAAQSRKMLDAGDYLAEHFPETPAVVIFCFNPREMAITDAKLDRISVVGGGSVYPAVQNLLLDARALGEAPATMPPISAGPDVDTTQAVPAAPAPGGAGGEEEDDEPQASLKRAIEPESACMYGPRGRLLHEPTGRECAAIRVSAPSQQFDTDRELEARTSTKRKSQVGCVYGSRGQLLYSSPGLECAG